MLLSRLQVLITGDNSSAIRSLSAVDRAVTRTSATMDLLGVKSAGRLAVATSGLGSAFLVAASAGQSLTTVVAGIGGGALAGALGAVGAGATGLAAAFVAAGAGVAAWGAIAYPVLSQTTTAFTEYAKAVEDGKKALAAGDTKGVTAAVEAQAKALALLSPEQKTVVGELVTLKDTWLETSRALERPTLSIFSTGLRTISDLLPRIVPLAAGVGGALQDVAFRIEDGFKGDVFSRFLRALEQESPLAVSQVATVGGNLAGALMNGFITAVPTMRVVMDGLVGATERLEQAAGGQGFARFLSYGVEMMAPFNSAMGSLTGSLVALLVGLAPLGTTGLGALERLGDGLTAAFSGSGMAAFRESVLTLMPLAGDAVGELGGAFGALMDLVRPLGPVVLETLGGIGALLAETFRSDAAVSFVSSLSTLLPQLLPILGTVLSTVVGLGSAFLEQLVPVLPQLQGPIAEVGTSLGLIGAAVFPLLQYLPQAAVVIAQLAAGAVVLVGWLVKLADLVLPAVLDGLEWLTTNPEVTAALMGIGGAAAMVVNTIAGLLPVLGGVLPWLSRLGPILAAIGPRALALAGPVGVVVAAVITLGQVAWSIYKNWDSIVSFLGKAWDWIAKTATTAATTARDVWLKYTPLGLIVSHWSQITGFFASIPGAIKSAFSSAGSWLYNAGRDVIAGLLNGLRSLASKPWEFVRSIGTQIIDGFKAMFGIHSPSRVMAEMGGFLTEGLLGGIEGGQRDVLSAWGSMGDQLKAPVSLSASLAPGGSTLAGIPAQRTVGGVPTSITINVNGAGDPAGVGRAVRKELEDLLSEGLTDLRQGRGGR